MKEEFTTFQIDGKEYECYLVSPHTTPGPCIMLFHNFMGQSEFDRAKARELAEQGYTCFCADVYGKGKRAKDHAEADILLHELTDNRAELLNRILGNLAFAKQHAWIDETLMMAIGFCFGGKCVLDLVRSGEKLAGVVSFHGVYDRASCFDETPIISPVLILDGWDDPLTQPAAKIALAKELTDLGTDWQFISFGHTGHAFTNPAVNDKESNFFYQPASDQRAWKYTLQFISEQFQLR